MHRILFVRHGECYMNLELADKIGGRSVSSPLTPLGEEQAKLLGEFLQQTLCEQDISSASFYSSTAVRTAHTGRIVMEKLERDFDRECILTDELLELDMGLWEGKNRKQCYSESTLQEIRKDVIRFKPPGGESQLDVEERMMRFVMENVIKKAEETGGIAIVFGHGLAIKCALRSILDSAPHMTRKIVLNNTSITEVLYTPEHKAANADQAGWQVVRVNDTSHLFKNSN